jgi:hypothetical protein
MGAAQGDDDADSHYGGIIFGYNENFVRLWAPCKYNGNSWGRIVNIDDGWGDGINNQGRGAGGGMVADVRVLVWA